MSGQVGSGNQFEWPSGLVAFWDFAGAGPPFKPAAGGDDLALRNGSGANVSVVDDGPFGQAASFNGTGDYLVIPADQVGALNVARSTGQCTVLAWVYREHRSLNFIAGMWNEDDVAGDACRQYGLFLNLPDHAPDRVCGHVSSTGLATPGYGHARDASANTRKIRPGEWRFIGFTYDGAQAVSYLDGIVDQRPKFTDELGVTYAKNPYLFTEGLNGSNVSDFTVGANKVGVKIRGAEHTDGTGLFFGGRIGGVAVFERALTQAEVMQIHLGTLADNPAVNFDFYHPDYVGADTAVAVGWKSVRGPAAMPTGDDLSSGNFLVTAHGEHFLFRSAIAIPQNRDNAGMGYFEDLAGVRASQVREVTFRLNNSLAADAVRLCVRIGDVWYATEQTFSVTGDGRRGFDWSDAETKTFTFTRAADAWRSLTLVPSTKLELGGVTGATIPDDDVTAIGFYNAGLADADSVIRINEVKVFAR